MLAFALAGQLGMTDTVLINGLASQTLPFCDTAVPHFTQSAIVPIPEPSILALTFFGGVSLLLFRRIRRR